MDKKELVLEFITDCGQVFNFQLVAHFTPLFCISAPRLARFLVAEGKIARRGPTEAEKRKFNLTARTIIYYIPDNPQGQGRLGFIKG